MRTCDWCGLAVEGIVPVHLGRDTQMDGFIEDAVDDGDFPADARYGQACAQCVEAGFVRMLNASQMRERHRRRERFLAASEVLFGDE